ncbi:MAG: preprotein translocase subunit YajC [Bdellovibrionales bacterium]|nr:preprotein translocase subunit YajC [Bdellovibrionales bacterium]
MATPPSGSEGAGGGLFSTLSLMIVIFGIVYFLMIRPEKKRQSEHQSFLNDLKKGDEVITQAGLFGKVTGVAEKVVTLEISDKVKVKVAKHSVAGLANSQATETQKSVRG